MKLRHALLASACIGWLGVPSGTALARDAVSEPATQRLTLHRLSLGDIGGLIEVTASVDGKPGRWLIDTGSTRHLVSRDFVERHGLKPRGKAVVATALGSLTGREVDLPPLQVGPIKLEGQSALLLDDFGPLLGAAGEGLDGVIGLPLLQGAVLDLDLRDWTLALTPGPLSACPPGTEPVPLVRHHGLPALAWRLGEGKPEWLLLDTGNPAGVVRVTADPPDPDTAGLGIPGDARLALANQVSLGGLIRGLVPVTTLHAPALAHSLNPWIGPRISGLAGTALIEGSRWLLALDQRQACVTPDKVTLPGGFGMTLAQRENAVWVDTVLQGGPAQAAGLRGGERLLQWAGGPVQGPLSALWARVQGKDSIELQVRYDGPQAPRSLYLKRAHFLPLLP